jgi:hypothetical protein
MEIRIVVGFLTGITRAVVIATVVVPRMSTEIRQDGLTASCDSCGRRAYEVRENAVGVRAGLNADDWVTDGEEAYCPRCDGEIDGQRRKMEREHEFTNSEVASTREAGACRRPPRNTPARIDPQENGHDQGDEERRGRR